MVGRKYEAGGIAKDGAKMVMAVANAQARPGPLWTGLPRSGSLYARYGGQRHETLSFSAHAHLHDGGNVATRVEPRTLLVGAPAHARRRCARARRCPS
jgi:hypothetical protein